MRPNSRRVPLENGARISHYRLERPRAVLPFYRTPSWFMLGIFFRILIHGAAHGSVK
jgi:hypothetical protein